MLAWRALAADKRTEENKPVEPSETDNRVLIEGGENEDKGDDVQLIIDMMRKLHGRPDRKTTNTHNRKQYLADQTLELGDIFQVEDIGISNTQDLLQRNPRSM